LNGAPVALDTLPDVTASMRILLVALLGVAAMSGCKSSAATGSGGAGGRDGGSGAAGTGGTGGVGGSADGGDAAQTDGAAADTTIADAGARETPADGPGDGPPPLPPLTWTRRTPPTTRYLNALASNGDIVVVVGENVILTSSDGVAWTSQTFPTSTTSAAQFENVTFGAGMFVAGGRQSRLMASPDGVTWTVLTTPVSEGWNGIAFQLGKFLATSVDLSSGQYVDSPDGNTWTARAVASDLRTDWTSMLMFGAHDVVFASGAFLVPGHNFLSLNGGMTWQRIPAWSTVTYDAAYGNGMFCIGASNGLARSSRDAQTWTSVGTPGGWSLTGMVFATDRFVAVGSFGTLLQSLDCVSWFEGSATPIGDQIPSSGHLNGVRVHKDKIIAVGDSGFIITAPLP
jgi:hypothetical protein